MVILVNPRHTVHVQFLPQLWRVVKAKNREKSNFTDQLLAKFLSEDEHGGVVFVNFARLLFFPAFMPVLTFPGFYLFRFLFFQARKSRRFNNCANMPARLTSMPRRFTIGS